MKKTSKPPKKPNISKLKKKVWTLFSKYIRLRDSVNGYCKCCTCESHLPIGEMNAGHYIHGNTKPTFFDERNVNAQCVRCNKWLSGRLNEYALFLENKYGVGILQELKIKSKGPVFNRAILEVLLETYELKIRELNSC